MHSKPIDVQHLSLNAHGISHVYTVLIPVLDPPEVPIAECWYAHLQLFYTCNDYTHGPDELQTTPMALMTSGLSWCSAAEHL